MELVILPGQIPTSRIELQTRLGQDIENSQPSSLSPFMMNQIANLPALYDKMIARNIGAVPAYNCHGFTFASRRTWIDDPAELKKILNDDRYQEVKQEKDVLPGDVIIYFDEKNIPEHSGLVVREPSKSPLNIALVCSKWGGFGEVVHDAHYGPYSKGSWRFYRVI